MAILPQRLLRLTGFSTNYLTGTAGNNGEVYYDLQTKSLRIMDGTLKGGYQLARTDLNNVTNAVVSAKVTASGVLTWSNVSGKPTFSTVATSGSYADLSGKPNLSTVATSGSYTDLTNKPTQVSTFANDAGYLTTVAWSAVSGKPTFSTVATSGSYTDLTNTPAPVSLTGYATESFVNTQISNLVDGAPGVLNTLNELAAAINDDSTFAGTVFAALDSKATIENPTITGTLTVTGTTTPFSISGFSHSAGTDRVSVNYESMFWKSDGTRFYIHDNTINDIFEYICSEAWNPSTATAGLTLDYSSQKNAISASLDMRAPIYIKPDGTAIYIMGSIGPSDYMFYTLALNSPWSISSATLTLSSGTITGTPITGFTFKPDGDKVYVSAGGITSQFDLATAWDLNSVLAPTGFNQSNYLPGSAYGGGIAFNATGSKIYYVNLNGGIFSFDLTTPYAITSTVSSSLASFDLSTISTFSYAGSGSVQWSSDGTKLFIGGQNVSYNSFVYRYNIAPGLGSLETDNLTVDNLTVSGLGRFSYQNITPAGSTQGDAAAITKNLVMILNTAPSGGIRLPASQPYGTRILVRNSAASSRSVYPPSGEEVQGAGAVNSAYSHASLSWREYIKTANPLGSGADWWWVLTPT